MLFDNSSEQQPKLHDLRRSQVLVFTILMIVLVALLGGCAKYIVYLLKSKDYYYAEYLHISWIEALIAFVVICGIVAPITYKIGDSLSVSEQLEYKEFYNGVETDAIEYVRNCSPGRKGDSAATGRSNCHFTYVCGRYDFDETYQVAVLKSRPDGKGGTETYTDYETRTRTVTANIYCPYLTQEFTYQINDSLPGGEHRLAGVYGDEVPTAWDTAKGIPSNIPLGPPAEWLDARRRLDAGDPRSVTRIFTYDNFILAAQEDLILPYSEDIERFKQAGILPEHTRNIMSSPLYGYSKSYADKLSFVGVDPSSGEDRWQKALLEFNGALGMTLRGDVHMVVIDSKLVTSKVGYVNALKAYWIGDDFGRLAIAKNAIIIVVGVSDGVIEWAEASTGMPYGNEVMLENISGRIGRETVPFTPEALIGNPRLTFVVGADGEKEPTVHLAENPGILEQIIFRDYPFARASMSCEDDDDGESCVGFSHLVSKLEPTTSAKILMSIPVVFLSILLWWACAYFEWFGWILNPSVASERRQNRLDDRNSYT